MPGQRAGTVHRNRLRGQFDRLQRAVGRASKHGVEHGLGRPPCQVVGFGISAPAALGQAHLLGFDFGHHGADHLPRDAFLQIEHIAEHILVPLGPDVEAGLGVDQLRRDAQAVARASDTALQQKMNPQLAPHPGGVDVFVLVGERGVAGNDEQAPETRQRGDDLLYQAIREIPLLRVIAYRRERQHHDRRPVRQAQRWRRGGFGLP